MSRKRPTRKIRVDFRQNRQQRRRTDDWTQRFKEGDEGLQDTERVENVRAKGDLSRKRTILVDDQDIPLVEESLWRPSTIVKVHGLIAYADDGAKVWECTVRRILRTRQISGRSPVTVGDRVWFSDQSALCDGRDVGVIERVEPRRSVLSRRDFRQREHAIVANADQILIVISIAQPRLRPHLADRFIVAALKGGLRPILCFNKMDLLDDGAVSDEESDEQGGHPAHEVVGGFMRLGYQCILTSAVANVGIDELREALEGHITVLSGQSGVGKSSLINAIQPGLELGVQEVSEETEKGKHTTTFAELFRLSVGGYVVDTPGIRAWDVWNVNPRELEAYFEEFVPYVPKCKFRNCTHRGEAGCAIVAAVEAGEISERRYFSYVKMLEEV